ncbi:MAG: hypothetical protein AAGA48_05485 [Myxococcota bacterium]
MANRLDPDVLSAALEVLTQRTARSHDPPAAPKPLWVESFVVNGTDLQPDFMSRANRSAMLAMQTFAPDCVELWRALRLPGWEVLPTDPKRVDEILSGLERRDAATEAQWPEAKLAHEVYRRVTERLASRSIQDLRVQLTSAAAAASGPDIAVAIARAFAIDAEQRNLPDQITLELGSLAATDAPRTVERLVTMFRDWRDHHQTPFPALQLTVDDLSDRVIGALTPLLDHLERSVGWPLGTVGLEWHITRPAAVLANARYPLSTSVSRGRLRSVRVDLESLRQTHGTAVADLVLATARAQVSETSIQLSAGRSPNLRDLDPEAVSPAERAERFAEVHEVWRRGADRVHALLKQGVSWGTDDDPRQLPARWAAYFAYARSTWPEVTDGMAETLLRCLAGAEARPDLLWRGQELLTKVLRMVDAGALSLEELAPSGLDADDLAGRSFALMVQRRRPS